MVIKKCLGTVGLEHFMMAVTMKLKLREHARRQCNSIFDETYSMPLHSTISAILVDVRKFIQGFLIGVLKVI